jgi:uncharacterized protein YuzE
MKARYDKVADAMYLYVKKGKVARTRKVDDRLLVDVDRKGNIIGIEMLDVSSQISRRGVARTLRAGKIPVAA